VRVEGGPRDKKLDMNQSRLSRQNLQTMPLETKDQGMKRRAEKKIDSGSYIRNKRGVK